jgi:hypothetical protein
VRDRTDAPLLEVQHETMSYAMQSPSTRHKRAAADHELAALQHRTAAEHHDKSMLHAARRSSEDAKECSLKAHKQSLLACQQSAYTTSAAGAHWRSPAIRRIIDARFSMAALEESRNGDPVSWNSARNDMDRGIHGEAVRESRRLEDATDAELQAELAAITTWAQTQPVAGAPAPRVQDYPRRVEAFQTD